jgi:hypothetical protein
MSDEAPKSAYELAMERLRSKDREAGVEERPLTDEQRSRIAELRKVFEAKLAEAEIMKNQKLARVRDYGEQEAVEEEYRRDRERITGERDRKIDEVRRSG